MSAAGARLRLAGPAPVAGALRAGATVVDGRAPDAFDAGHLPGAVNVPAGPGAGELAAMVLSRGVPVLALLPDVPTVACCSDGHRAAVAASALRRWGHRNVWRVADGGVDDPLERPIGLDLLGAA